ncbi:hypothetical protein RI129_010278 [Pyrocoelia pectoralis]|uniref:Uncharacterized protein n=1 Tax=Pyrocoelia pectoralis TaxID=417401 RepID=A0AAN7VB00_9COLE
MVVTSKTGLLASTTKKLIRTQNNSINLKVVATSAPYILKPFAGLYNPYPYGCSLLCNHPADTEARDLVRRAKDSWANEGKNLLLSDEVDAIRASLSQLHVKMTNGRFKDDIPIGSVPEELFRRYTETDSRPLTPAPTLVSAHTRASGSRRCVTPDPMLNTDVREKTQLILDLRRSHSQDRKSSAATHLSSDTSETPRQQHRRRNKTSASTKPSLKNDNDTKPEKVIFKMKAEDDDNNSENEPIEEEESVIKRRGRRRRKRGRDTSRGPPAFQSSIDPETLVATIGPESHNPSARPSLVPNDTPLENAPTLTVQTVPDRSTRNNSFEINSYLDHEILKLLRRELDEEVIENEFNIKRRKALEEAFKTQPIKKPICNELKELKEELQKSFTTKNTWLGIPRMFSRTSARFELPMDSRELSAMTPLQYVTDYVFVSSSRKPLYNHIFKKFINENDSENEHQRVLLGKNVLLALNEVMSKDFNNDQGIKIRNLIEWDDDTEITFKTFCGLSALCERLLAPDYPLLLLPKHEDPCHEIETIDFKSLERKLENQNVNPNLVQILYGVRDS